MLLFNNKNFFLRKIQKSNNNIIFSGNIKLNGFFEWEKSGDIEWILNSLFEKIIFNIIERKGVEIKLNDDDSFIKANYI